MSPAKKKKKKKKAKAKARKSPARAKKTARKRAAKKAASSTSVRKRAAAKKKAAARKQAAARKKSAAKRAAAAKKKKAVAKKKAAARKKKAAAKKKAMAKKKAIAKKKAAANKKAAAIAAQKKAAEAAAKLAAKVAAAEKAAAEKAAAPPPVKRGKAKPTGPQHPKLGYKWDCFNCEAKFYDLNKEDPVCPKCDADQRDKPKVEVGTKAKKKAKKVKVRPMVPIYDDDEAAQTPEEIEIAERTRKGGTQEVLFLDAPLVRGAKPTFHQGIDKMNVREQPVTYPYMVYMPEKDKLLMLLMYEAETKAGIVSSSDGWMVGIRPVARFAALTHYR